MAHSPERNSHTEPTGESKLPVVEPDASGVESTFDVNEAGEMSPEELEERIRLAERIVHLQSTLLGVEADGAKSPDFPYAEGADA